MKKEETKQDIIKDTLESKIIDSIMPEIKEKVMKEVDDLTKTVRKRIKTIKLLQVREISARKPVPLTEKHISIMKQGIQRVLIPGLENRYNGVYPVNRRRK